MKTAMSAASTRDNDSMRVVRTVFSSAVLDQPGGRKSVSLGSDGAGVDAKSSMGWVPTVLEAS